MVDAHTGDHYELTNKECTFGYRDSIFKHHPRWVIVSAELDLQPHTGTAEELTATIRATTKERVSEQSIGERTAGSTFKGVPNDAEMVALIRSHKRIWNKPPYTSWLYENRRGFISAGFLIEMAGLKGRRVGDVMVSPKHANFIINCGDGTAEQVVMLVGIIKEHIHRKFGVQLEEEIQYVGF